MHPNDVTCAQIHEAVAHLTAKQPEIARENREFHDHLRECADCRAHYQEAVAEISLLQGWAAPEPRGDTQARVMAGIARAERELREQERRQGGLARAVQWLIGGRIRVPALAATAIAVLLLASIALNTLLLAWRPDGPREAAPTVNHSIARVDRNVLDQLTPEGTPSIAPVFDEPPFLGLGRYSQHAAMPLGIIVILGVPPDERTPHATHLDI